MVYSKKLMPLVFFFSSFGFHPVFSQTKDINGKVTDSLTHPIPFATIQILDSLKNIEKFSFTDNNGKFAVSYSSEKGNTLKISHIGYSSLFRSVDDLENKDTLTFILKEKAELLEEVELIEFDYGVKTNRNKDSIFYDISKFVRGTESTLGDVLERLPGMGITSNGKITYNNKIIDELLIEDNEFFGNMHQLATQNIDAEAVKSAEVYQNYQRFGTLETNPDQDLVAVNIKVKDAYKNKFSGNGKVEYGIENKYLLGLNLFNFNRGPRVNFISNSNNKGVQPISVQDYTDLQLGEYEHDASIETGLVVSNSDPTTSMPDFLQTSKDVFENEDHFSGINFNWKPNQKIKIDFFSFLNQKKQNGYANQTQKYILQTSDLTIQNEDKRRNSSLVNLTKLKATFVPNKRNTVKYYLSFTPQKSELNNTILNKINSINSIDQENNANSYRLKNTLNYNTALSKKVSWNTYLSHLSRRNDYSFSINSSQPLFIDLFPNQVFEMGQRQQFSEESIQINSTFYFGFHRNKNKFNLLFERENSRKSFTALGRFSRLENSLNLMNDRISSKALYMINTNNLTYKFGASLHHYQLQFQDENSRVNQFTPNISFTAKFSALHRLILSYNNSIEFPEIKSLNSNFLLENFQRLTTSSHVLFQNSSPKNEYNINYFNIDLGSKYIFTSISYSEEKNVVGNNTIFQGQNIYNEPNIIPEVSKISAVFAHEFSFNRHLPYKVGLNVLANNQKSAVKINGLYDRRILLNISSNARLFSNYLNRSVNFDFKIHYDKNVIRFQKIKQENTFELFSAGIGLDGKHFEEQFIWKLFIQQQQSKTVSNKVFYSTINAQLKFKKTKSKFDVSIEGNDLLNLTSNQLLRTNNNHNYIEEEMFLRFPGFLTFNVNFSI